ncbi:MAG: BatA domain-containing protein [Verrucomicrobia bacterium]|nr:BatA domain-containing protein [Verrucomicrobiota bacterium]MDA1066222.1 BatA domain-containing protein [Verrucomicrobiota bacterium]
MSFLSPWFLLGAAAIVGPVIFHLIRRATRNKVQFSSTQFLSASPPRLQKKSNLQHPWLLLLRCLVIALLAFGFSRPFLKRDVPLLKENNQEHHTVLILDESASMRRTGQWEAAKSQLINWVEETGQDHRLSIIGVSDQVSYILSNELWEKTPSSERVPLVRSVLKDREPGWGATYLDSGIDTGLDELEQLAENTGTNAKKTIRIFSDLTNGSRLTGLAGRDWPDNCVVEFEPTVGGETRNAGLQWLGWSKIGEGPRNARLSLITTGENQTITLKAIDAVTGQLIGQQQTVYSQVGDKRLFIMEIPEDQTNPLTIQIEGDSEPFDNTFYVAPKNKREATLPFIGSQASDDPKAARFYMERAVSGWKDPKISITTAEANWEKNTASLLLIGETPTDSQARGIQTFLSNGGTALLLLTNPSQIELIESITGEAGWKSPKLSRNYGLFGTIDFEHPIFKIFADPRYNNFTNIRFWNANTLLAPDNSEARILAKFDEGPAAVVEWKVGDGSLIAWGGDWTPQASQWVLSSKFVPWFQELIEQSLGGPTLPTMAFVNESDQLAGDGEVIWTSLGSGVIDANSTKAPGLYQLGSEGESHWVALNIPHEESRIDSLPFDTWEKLGVPLEASQHLISEEISEQQAAAKNAIELEGEQKLWRWLLIGTALFLAFESLLSIKISRRGFTPAEA